ncbi:hypothetical protein [Bordetella bronchialis]|uniref:Uncharacterized protein n=1 Tax=Bordetella bronchialis TaxID=463025 RepID=A0ABM6CR70_9BORD|nr:hypothetical protein [Bordetella bronchialis]ANN66438.1 hypothetical protein BAU06_09155 [Bordetella bronchialis]
MTNQPNEIWLSWEDSAGYGYWDTRDEAELNSAEDFHPVRFVPAASEADPILYQHSDGRYGLSLTGQPGTFTAGDPEWYRVPLDVVEPAASEAGAVPPAKTPEFAETIDYCNGWNACRAAMLAPAPAAQPEKQHVPDMLAELGLNQHAQPENQAAQTSEVDALRAAQADAVMPLIGPLLDAWEGLPNDLAGEDDLSELKRHVAAINHAMLNAAPPAPSQQAGADADYPPEIWKEDAPAAQSCPTDVCQAAKRDGVLCANDECDIATGVRAPAAPVLRTAKPGEIGLQEKRLPNGEYILEAAPAAQGDERAAFEAAFTRAHAYPEAADQTTFRKGWQAGIQYALSRQPSAPASAAIAAPEWRGLSVEECARFVDDICNYGTSFVSPLFAVVESIEKRLRELNSAALAAAKPANSGTGFNVEGTGRQWHGSSDKIADAKPEGGSDE